MIYTCTTFTGHYPVGVAAVVRAENATEAARILNDWLKSGHSLPGDAKPKDMIEFPENMDCRILCDGDY